MIILQRDVSEGQVSLGRWGVSSSVLKPPAVSYSINAEDKSNMIWAMKKAINILAARGAKIVNTTHSDRIQFRLSDDEEERKTQLEAIYKALDEQGLPKHAVGVSLHMSCLTEINY